MKLKIIKKIVAFKKPHAVNDVVTVNDKDVTAIAEARYLMSRGWAVPVVTETKSDKK